MFIKQFSATKKLMAFFEEEAALIQDVEKNYYIQRNILNYEKIIDRTRKAVARILSRGES